MGQPYTPWRARPVFQPRVEQIRVLLDGFEPHTLDLAAEIDQSGGEADDEL